MKTIFENEDLKTQEEIIGLIKKNEKKIFNTPIDPQKNVLENLYQIDLKEIGNFTQGELQTDFYLGKSQSTFCKQIKAGLYFHMLTREFV